MMMSTKDSFEFLDLKLLEAIRSKNANFFTRVTDNDQEVVDYFNESSIRIWYNKEQIGFKLHWHYATEIIVAIEQTYTVRTRLNEYVLNPGDILILPAGELHELSAPDDGSRLICLFDYRTISQLNGFATLLPFISQPVYLKRDETSSNYNRCLSLIKQIAREYADGNPFYELVIYARLLSLFVTIGRSKSISSDEAADLFDSKHNDLSKKLAIAFEFIDSHYMDDLSLDKVAAIAGFSKFHFSRLFKECSGQTFHDYLCYKRVQASESMLLNPNFSITEIAFKSGFSSLSTFNRAFKTINQCSPTEYRMLYNRSM